MQTADSSCKLMSCDGLALCDWLVTGACLVLFVEL